MATMPQNGVNYEGRRRGPHRNICNANSQVNGQVPGTGLVNGAAVHNGCPAAATKTRESTPAGTPNGAKPQCTVNGHINHGYKGKSTKAAPPKTFRNQGRTISAVTDASAVGGVRGGQTPGGVLVKGATRLDAVAAPFNSDETALQSILSTAAKKQRARNKFRHKRCATYLMAAMKIDRYFIDLQEKFTTSWFKIPPQMPPQEEEDWENEIQEVTLIDWEKMCFGVQPYGPEDVLHFALRDLTLKQRDTADLLVTANYRPVVHHRPPIQWSCYNIPTEAGQFADADE
ncbi:hypothetical protein L3Q82_019844 [Scortum barcoo]|uniref:Uncharacterized protein n=1 Tax=Scortum barcoo TaxID=214431 RepID=A0ACB8VCW2_9TELE|nr:hypothetical protein L3Q82_019844 [Scortum barcoo]